MTDLHPITPPQWQVDAWCKQAMAMGADVDAVFLEAFRAGADQELGACCEWASQFNYDDYRYEDELRAFRRPKPPSLKEQALHALLHMDQGQHNERTLIIRRALEQLPD